MKLAFVVINANRHEGTSRAVLEVAERLALQNHEVDWWSRTSDMDAQERLNWIRVLGPGRPEIADFASFQWQVDRRIKCNKYDIVHSAGPNTCHADIYTIQTVHPVKMKLMAAARASLSASCLRRLSWSLYDRYVVLCESKSYVQTGARGLRGFLPVSSGTQIELLTHYPKAVSESEPTNVSVVPNGADLDLFHPRNRELHRHEIRREHGLDQGDFLLLFSGGDWRRKGLDLAVRSLAFISETRVKLLVVGDDRNGADIKELVDHLRLRERVRFVGFRKNVHAYYSAGDLFLFPTMYEAFSLATIEAAASGLPVLMPDVSGAQELIGSGKAGTVIRREPEHIADTVMRYFRSPDRVHDAAIAARDLVEREFSWDSIADKTMIAYERLLRARGNRK